MPHLGLLLPTKLAIATANSVCCLDHRLHLANQVAVAATTRSSTRSSGDGRRHHLRQNVVVAGLGFYTLGPNLQL